MYAYLSKVPRYRLDPGVKRCPSVVSMSHRLIIPTYLPMRRACRSLVPQLDHALHEPSTMNSVIEALHIYDEHRLVQLAAIPLLPLRPFC